jgi:hypothetical protein
MKNIGSRLKSMARSDSEKHSAGKIGTNSSIMEAPKAGKNSSILENIGHELKQNPPKILAKTRAKKGEAAANKQRVAILMSKARALHAKV